MKVIVIFIMLALPSISIAVGWDELSKQDLSEKGISIETQYSSRFGCFEFTINLPQKLFFESLGYREFSSARYRDILEKEKGWQLVSKGTYISLPLVTNGENITVQRLCLAEADLKSAYLSVGYSGPSGTPPMVILLRLEDYK